MDIDKVYIAPEFLAAAEAETNKFAFDNAADREPFLRYTAYRLQCEANQPRVGSAVQILSEGNLYEGIVTALTSQTLVLDQMDGTTQRLFMVGQVRSLKVVTR